MGDVANAEFDGGGEAKVVGGAAAIGCVAVGKRTCCARAASASVITSAATRIRRVAFNGSADNEARRVKVPHQRMPRARKRVINIPREIRQLRRPGSKESPALASAATPNLPSDDIVTSTDSKSAIALLELQRGELNRGVRHCQTRCESNHSA